MDARHRGWIEGVAIAAAVSLFLWRKFRAQPTMTRARTMQKLKTAPSQKLLKTDDITNANFPLDKEGRTYHVGCKKGEIANRILTTGCPTRAASLAKYLDSPFVRASSRGFTVFTGLFRGTPVSIIASGMARPAPPLPPPAPAPCRTVAPQGLAMMDFCVREVRAVTEGPLAIVRLGSCGGVNVDAGAICIADESMVIQRELDAFLGEESEKKAGYRFSAPIPADPILTEHIVAMMQRELGAARIHVGLNVTADSFYASQGRQDPNFDDRNGALLEGMPEGALTLEMETGQLLHLAACSRESIIASAIHMVFANRRTNYFLPNHDIAELEHSTGRAALVALCSFPMPSPGNGGVWSREHRRMSASSPATAFAAH
eukprot:tig00000802_g4283.t1